ncbi:zinc-binding dehydrogenase [Burkholderia anthina]|uniref:quinone oxidoreductase family protein n=1 Tax=Burkholderia anthina TaxID=179879 RepID=UPI00158BDF30|nr:zinc-binding dehydrogenase [Burkholderia anthina]
MRAIQLNEYGSVENYQLVDIPAPVAGPGQVRIKVEYSGMRWGDVMHRKGTIKRDTPPPFIAGLEAAGRIDQVGEGVTGLEIGDKVAAMVLEGGFAEYVVAPAIGLKPLPSSAPLDKVLGYFLNLRVAYMIVYQWAKVRDGETVLLHAATGGVGLLVLQILKRKFKNVRVIGICSSDEKAQLLRANGCDHIVNRKTQNYVDEVNRICGPKTGGFAAGGEQGGGVDVSINGVSGPTIETDKLVIRKRGRWVIFGRQAEDNMPAIDTHSIGYDGITIMPFSIAAWFGQPEWEESEVFTQEWLEDEALNEMEQWPLEQVAAAELEMESGRSSGKIVIKVASGDE